MTPRHGFPWPPYDAKRQLNAEHPCKFRRIDASYNYKRRDLRLKPAGTDALRRGLFQSWHQPPLHAWSTAQASIYALEHNVTADSKRQDSRDKIQDSRDPTRPSLPILTHQPPSPHSPAVAVLINIAIPDRAASSQANTAMFRAQPLVRHLGRKGCSSTNAVLLYYWTSWIECQTHSIPKQLYYS